MVSRYVLGVYDKKTQVMKMYDTEMITLQPQILGNDLLNSICQFVLICTVHVYPLEIFNCHLSFMGGHL